MHPAPAFLETDRKILLERVQQWPFALVVGVAGGRAYTAHTPVLASEDGSLQFHLAKANPTARAITESGHALIVFSGPHDYISPDWYGMEQQVPTWNYLSVEAAGPVTLSQPDDAKALLDTLSTHFETGLAPKPVWRMSDVEPARIDRMVALIQAFCLQPQRLEGITKIGQNKPAEARIRAGKALKAAGGDTTLAAMMERDQ